MCVTPDPLAIGVLRRGLSDGVRGRPYDRWPMVERIGVYGGTFDPPHHAHLAVAVEAAWALELDRVLLVVAGDPWQKSSVVAVSSASDRLALAAAAVEGLDRVEVDDIEVRRGGPSYTIDTVEALAGPGREITVLLGADAAATLPTWHRATDLAAAVEVAVTTRPGWDVPALGPGWRVRYFDVPSFDISSTDIRRRVTEGRPIAHLLPAAVRAEMDRRGLYRSGR